LRQEWPAAPDTLKDICAKNYSTPAKFGFTSKKRADFGDELSKNQSGKCPKCPKCAAKFLRQQCSNPV
jgi:hypothetical protein